MASERDENPNPYVSPASPPRGQDPRNWEPLVPGEVLRIQGVLSPKDLFAANKLTTRPEPSDVFGCIFLLVFVLLPWGVMLSLWVGWVGAALTALFGLCIAVSVGCRALLKMRQINRYWRHQRGVCQPQRIEISDTEIRQQTETGWSVYRWSAFSNYTGSRRVMVLQFDPPSAFFYDPPQAFVLVPRSFFAGDWDWDRFVRLVHQKLPPKYHQGRAP